MTFVGLITALLGLILTAPAQGATKPAAKPVRLAVSAPQAASAGAPFDVVVTAVTRSGKRASGFRGETALAVAGDDAVVPSSHRFTKRDRGRYTFRGLELSTPGERAVTARSGRLRGRDSVSVATGELASIELSVPADATAGQNFAATVAGFDARGNELPAGSFSSTLAISPDGSCSASACTATTPGSHTVTASSGSASDTAEVRIAPGVLNRLELSRVDSRTVRPAPITVAHAELATRHTYEATQAYSVRGFDAHGNPLGDLTSRASLSVDGTNCSGAVCTGTVPGQRTVTASVDGVGATATMDVAGYDDAYDLWCHSGRWYDINGAVADGCEVENPFADHAKLAGAKDLGSKPCSDGSSKIDESTSLYIDNRSHSNQYDSSAPMYWKVKATGGTFCVNDTVLDVTMSGGVDGGQCYTAKTWFTGDESGAHTTRFDGSGKVRIADGLWYQGGSTIHVKVQHTCSGQPRGITSVRLEGHL